jgi:hypothetical protein
MVYQMFALSPAFRCIMEHGAGSNWRMADGHPLYRWHIYPGFAANHCTRRNRRARQELPSVLPRPGYLRGARRHIPAGYLPNQAALSEHPASATS